VARRKRAAIDVGRWSEDAASVWTGLADWRAAHPTATFEEIEAALDERLNQVRARVLSDLALASAATDVASGTMEERPRCTRCGGVLQARGGERPDAADAGRGRGAAPADVHGLSHMRGRVFPPGR